MACDAPRRHDLDGRGNLLVRYRGPGGTFPHLSATDVIAGRVQADTVRDRIVFVGATALVTTCYRYRVRRATRAREEIYRGCADFGDYNELAFQGPQPL